MLEKKSKERKKEKLPLLHVMIVVQRFIYIFIKKNIYIGELNDHVGTTPQ